MFTIQQAADELSVSSKTLRQWEAQGLLPFVVARTRGGHRRYQREQILQLKEVFVAHAGQLPRGGERQADESDSGPGYDVQSYSGSLTPRFRQQDM